VLILEDVAGRDMRFDLVTLAIDIDTAADEWMKVRVVAELIRLRQRHSVGRNLMLF
jgi:hypothetical protein